VPQTVYIPKNNYVIKLTFICPISSCFRFTKTNVQPKSKHCILQGFMSDFLSSCHIMVTFEIRRSEPFWKIILDQTVGIHDINLDCKGLKLPPPPPMRHKNVKEQKNNSILS
jgi:hypothetical protein